MNANRMLLAAAMAVVTQAAAADVVSEARQLIDSGDYPAALQVLDGTAARTPQIAQLMGECLFFEGDYDGARKWLDEARRGGVADANLLLGRLAFLDYDFGRAGELYAAWRKATRKDPANPDIDPGLYEQQLRTADEYLDRVEDIVILDSVSVPADAFMRALQLPPSAGSLRMPSVLPTDKARAEATMAYVSENGNTMMWAEPDAHGVMRLAESFRLTDGSWSHPALLDEQLNGGGNADFPFLMPDGTTLYFASDGEGSVGGYDLYVATRDPSTGEWMQPQNLGFPYNSPYDDYMMAIDEENGTGWWVTARDNAPRRVTVYTFAVNDLRRNLSPDRDDLADRARITSVAATRPEGMMMQPPRNKVTNAAAGEVQFRLPMPGQRVYTNYGDFGNQQAARLMRQYVELAVAYDQDKSRLDEVRRQYDAAPGSALAAEARRLEHSVAGSRRTLESLRSEVYRLELGR